ncbi:response regulator [Candidatus Vondammii sp. HM_W22]|uniref:response regulator n=1 Tax=Candidatus Vondammii sp. HM_W22 TaxID=2687299 RepID=UPI001F1473E3|nr:response regulator [Candidatus Vondammii sp. HM_W22]
MIKVLLVDDHELVRTGFRHILQGESGIEVVGEADSGEKAVKMAIELGPDLVLMDVNMPGIGGIEATRKVRRYNQNTQIIAVTVLSDAPFPEQLYNARALGYLTKGCPAEEMFDAIRTVASGGPFIAGEVSRKLTIARLTGTNPDSPFNQLSSREMQVLMMIIQGQKTQDISDSLCLSPETVSTYRHRLFEKLNVETDVELTLMALRHGLVSTGS